MLEIVLEDIRPAYEDHKNNLIVAENIKMSGKLNMKLNMKTNVKQNTSK